jgi:hypothetical protein
MQVKLRQVGNSIGTTFPAGELKVLGLNPGDIVDIEIIRIVRHPRSTWNNDSCWLGCNDEPHYLEDLPTNDFDDKEWQW